MECCNLRNNQSTPVSHPLFPTEKKIDVIKLTEGNEIADILVKFSDQDFYPGLL